MIYDKSYRGLSSEIGSNLQIVDRVVTSQTTMEVVENPFMEKRLKMRISS